MRHTGKILLGVRRSFISILPAAFLLGTGASAFAQATPYVGAGCVTSINNVSSQVDTTGSFVIPNVPVTGQKYRVRTICPQPNGITMGYVSAPMDLVPNGNTLITTPMPVGPLAPQPSSLLVLTEGQTLGAKGSTVQLLVQAVLPNDTAYDATDPSNGTTYTTSNAAVATVDANGVVTANAPGTVYITASNDGLSGTVFLSSFATLDSDGDGMPDAYEIANGLNPYDPSDANIDSDNDGLTNLQEYLLGTNPRVADTDGDGLNDGDEVRLGTNPLVADTDGDGLSDGDEVRLGTNPLVADTDGDGIPDGIEVKLGLNPLVPDITTVVIGHVTNPDGTPATSVAVALLTYYNTLTDATGAFTIPAVPTTLGTISVAAQAIIGPSVYSGTSKATTPVPSGTTDVGTIQLGQSAGQVSGTITTPDKKPVGAVQVTVTGGATTRTTTTDYTGLYSVSGLPAGPVSVAAFDPATSLRGQALGNASSTTPLILNIQLASYGTVAGTVRNSAGQPVGAGVNVAIGGALGTTTLTDALGHYSFSFVPLGYVVLDATDASGHHGRSTGTVTATSQNLAIDVQYLPLGTVSGTVTNGGSGSVAGAIVMLNNGGLVNQSLTTTSNSLGQYTFANVYAGVLYLSATNAAMKTGGSVTSSLSTEGQSVTADIPLQGTATLSGTVYHSDGKTPAAGAVVAISSTAFATTADASGKYQFSNVPLNPYQINANDTATVDRGYANLTLSTAGADITQDISFIGLGNITVTVTDASGATPIANAQVSVNTSSPLGTTLTGVTGTDGTTTISNVLAGSISAQAVNPATGLSGNATATLAAGQQLSITVALRSAGTVRGVVYQSDAKTIIPGIRVALDDRRTLTDANGAYQFDNVPTGGHSMSVADFLGNTLATNNSVQVTSQGQVVTANFVIVGLGTVAGTITNPDGSTAAGIPVQVISFVPGDNQPYGTQSDANGKYTVPGVPIGPVVVVAQQHTSSINSYGNGEGAVTSNAVTTINIQLSTSLVPTSLTLADANGESYPIRETGALVNGSFGIFSGDSDGNQGGSLLSLAQNGNETPFTGEDFAPTDLSGRQISITQNNVDGLNVTRRVYVPQDGYFARYLEILTNPGASDVTVDVKLKTNLRQENRTLQTADSQGNPIQTQSIDLAHILSTSSGDTILNIADPNSPDHWVSLGGPLDDDPFIVFKPANVVSRPIVYRQQQWNTYSTLPAVADVFDGPGSRLSPTSAGYSSDASGAFSVLSETYSSVKVPAGGSVSLLHFLVQENSYTGATTGAARLVQLPPEALAGLNNTDLSSVANFVIPAGGTSTLSPLPSLTSAVSGFVYAADGGTPVPGAGVSLQSSDPIFGRLYTTGSDGNGAFVFQGAPGSFAIPAANYNVQATHPLTQVLSPLTAGTFSSGSVASSQNIVFSNTATLTGTVKRGPVVLNTAGTVTVTGGSLATPITIRIAADGTYTLTGVPVDTSGNAALNTYTLTAAVTNTLLTGTTTAVVAASQTVTADITIGGAGSVTGVVTRPDGSLAIGDVVYLKLSNGSQLTATVDTSGRYLVTDVPTGTYAVSAYDSQSNASLTVSVTVAVNATVTQDLALQSAGVVNGAVSVNDGSSVAGLNVTVTSTTTSGTQSLTGVTNSTGQFSVSGVKPGAITIRVTTPAGLQGTGTGNLPLAGQTVTINVVLTAAGSVTGTVYQADGKTPAAGLPVTISPAPLTGTATVNTDSNGIYSFQNVPIGNFSVSAQNPANGDSGQASSQIQTNGQLRTVNITLHGFGNLTVKLLDGNNNAFSGATITVSDNGSTFRGASDSTGSATFTQIPAGYATVMARDPATGLSASNGVTVAANSTTSLTLTLQTVGTVQGTIYDVDGTTPVVGATVQLNAPYGPSTTTVANGTYVFANQQVGGLYSVQVFDTAGHVRAKAPGQQLQTNGQTLTINLTFLGVGSVSGVVTNADGTRAENLTLSLVSQNPTIGGAQQVATGGDGTYSVSEVPLGNFTVTVQGLPSSQAGFGKGSIASNGDQETVNIQIISSTITLPTALIDGDSYPFTVQNDGSFRGTINLDDATNNTFDGAQVLSVSVNGANATFGDGSSPTSSIQTLSGQGIEINMPSLAGLVATRKIYVPSNGYFARRLDVLQNPTNAPLTVQVTEAGGERFSLNSPTITATSNGNGTVDSTTLWAVTQDGTKDPVYPRTELALASVFAGTGAPTGIANVTQNVTYYTRQVYLPGGGTNYITYSTQNWHYTYKTVTIPANSSVGFLFFTAQEGTPSTATTAAQRLVQLPAEALNGLTSSELASVANFVVPTSPLAAATQPPQQGPITGHVYTGDGAIAIPNAKVYEQSTDLLYGATATTSADANGAYALPVVSGAQYSLQAMDTTNGVISPMATGTITATTGDATTADILFTNTGILAGTLQPNGQSTYASATVNVYACANYLLINCVSLNTAVKPDGSFQFLDVPTGQVSASANVTTPQNSSYSIPRNGSYSIYIPAKQTTSLQLVLPATGNVTGTVTNADGSAAAAVLVNLYPANTGNYASIKTDPNGNYAFTSVQLDNYTVNVTDPITKQVVNKTFTVTEDTTQTVNIQFEGKGTINATVKFANGNIAANTQLTISTSTTPAYTYAGQSDANGLVTINNVPSGAFTVQALYPGQNFYSYTKGSITSDGQALALAITLPPVGIISGKVTYADGTPASGQYVNVLDQSSSSQYSYSSYGQTDSAGNYAIQPVPTDHVVKVTSNYYDQTSGRTLTATANNQQVPGDGQTLTVNLRYPGVANVAVTVQNADGSKVTAGTVTLVASDKTKYTASLGSTGIATIANVIEGSYIAYATSPYSNYALGSKAFTIDPSSDGTTVAVTITASPTATIQGQVYADDGVTKLNGNYSVVLTDVDTAISNYQGSYDTSGYQFQDVQVGASGYSITASTSTGGVTVSQTSTGKVTSQGQVIQQDFTLPVSVVSGTVFLFNGTTPAPNVSVSGTVGSGNSAVNAYGYTDANGNYQLSGLPAGTVTLIASDNQGVQGTSMVTLNSPTQAITGANISLEATGVVMGTVYDSKGQVVANGDVTVSSSADGGSFSTDVNTDGDGNYVITDVPVGNITVVYFDNSNNNQQVTGTGTLVHDGDSVTINVGVSASTIGTVFGTVYDSNGNPSSGATVTVSPANGSQTFTATTNDQGVYTAMGIPLGDLSVSATLGDGSTADPVAGTLVSSTTPIEVDLGLQDFGNVTGTVTMNGHPLGGAHLVLVSSADDNSENDEDSNSDGTYGYGTIPAGAITLQVRDDQGNVLATATGTLPYGGNLTLNIVVPQTGAALRLPSEHRGSILGPTALVETKLPAFAASLMASHLLQSTGGPAGFGGGGQ